MIAITQYLSNISTKLEKELNFVDSELAKLPEGRLVCEKQLGKLHYVNERYIDNVRKRKNLSQDDPEVPALVRKAILLELQKQLQKNLNILDRAVRRMHELDVTETIFTFKKSHPLVTDSMISEALSPAKDKSWANEPYEKYQYQDDRTKWQMSSFGLRLRSKSELLIAEMLHKSGIPFRYEQVLHLGEATLVPDFTIMRADGKLFYWEHEGLTNSRDYLQRQLKKSQIYALHNIVPWDNLIVSYDNADGIIDLRIVESEIRNKLL